MMRIKTSHGERKPIMRLFYAPASPFARIVRVALLETGLDNQVRKQVVTLRDHASALLPYNPVGRVPTLELDNGTILTESLLILGYIDTLHSGRPLLPRDGSDGWRTLAEMGIAAGMLEGIVTWARELRRPEHAQSPDVIALETTRVNRTADVLERAVANGGYSGEINAARMVLGCALGWVDPRHPVWAWRAGRPNLAAWFEAIAETPSFQATVPPPL
jgi:glutathione S-transferase